MFFPHMSIFYSIFSLLFSILATLPCRNSDPGSQSKADPSPSCPPTTVLALEGIFIARITQPFCLSSYDSRRYILLVRINYILKGAEGA